MMLPLTTHPSDDLLPIPWPRFDDLPIPVPPIQVPLCVPSTLAVLRELSLAAISTAGQCAPVSANMWLAVWTLFGARLLTENKAILLPALLFFVV